MDRPSQRRSPNAPLSEDRTDGSRGALGCLSLTGGLSLDVTGQPEDGYCSKPPCRPERSDRRRENWHWCGNSWLKAGCATTKPVSRDVKLLTFSLGFTRLRTRLSWVSKSLSISLTPGTLAVPRVGGRRRLAIGSCRPLMTCRGKTTRYVNTRASCSLTMRPPPGAEMRRGLPRRLQASRETMQARSPTPGPSLSPGPTLAPCRRRLEISISTP